MACSEKAFHLFPPRGVSLTRRGHDPLTAACGESGINCRKRNGFQVEVIFRPLHANDGLADAEILEIPGFEEGESFFEFFGVEIAETEADSGVRIRNDRRGYITVTIRQLMQLLVGENEPQII